MNNSEKDSTASPGPAATFSRNAIGVAVLIGFLILSLIPIRMLTRSDASEIEASPTLVSPSSTPIALVQEAAPTSTPVEPTSEEIVQITATSTSQPPTVTPTNTPAATPTPTEPPPSPTPTLTPSPTEAVATATSTATETVMVTNTLTTTDIVTVADVVTATGIVTDTPTPAPKPATVVYVQRSGQIHSLGMALSTGALLTPNLPSYASAPAWSPDGGRLAFFGEPGINTLGGLYSVGEGIWIMDSQGGNPIQLIRTDHVKNIVWSPDGQRLAYEFAQPGQAHQVIVFNLRTGQEAQFPGEQPAWSPSSQKLTIKACMPGCGLWHVNRDGSGGEPLTFEASDSYPAWSINGDMAFSSQRNGNWELYLLRQNSPVLQRLTNRPGTDITPVFNREGSEIYLRTDAFGTWSIRVMDLSGGNEREVRKDVGASDEWGLARPAVY